MRLENIVQVVPAEVKVSSPSQHFKKEMTLYYMSLKIMCLILQYKSETKFLTFETTTLVPYERKLIKVELMTKDEVCIRCTVQLH